MSISATEQRPAHSSGGHPAQQPAHSPLLVQESKPVTKSSLFFLLFLNVNDQTNPTINLRKALIPVTRGVEQTSPKRTFQVIVSITGSVYTVSGP